MIKRVILAFAVALHSATALALPCEGSRLAVTATNWSVKSPRHGSYLITVDLLGETEPMRNAIGRIFFTDSTGAVISSIKIDRHLRINPGSWTRQTKKSNDARWAQLITMSHADVSVKICVHSAAFDDGTTQAF